MHPKQQSYHKTFDWIRAIEVHGIQTKHSNDAARLTRVPVNGPLFIHFLVRLAFRPSGGAPNAPQLATTIASCSTTLAPTPRSQRLTTVGGWYDPIIQPFLSRFSARRFCSQAFLWHKNAWMAKLGILDPKPATSTPPSGHRSAP
jgi:hypothetical protein